MKCVVPRIPTLNRPDVHDVVSLKRRIYPGIQGHNNCTLFSLVTWVVSLPYAKSSFSEYRPNQTDTYLTKQVNSTSLLVPHSFPLGVATRRNVPTTYLAEISPA